jgi:hypothetical protein
VGFVCDAGRQFGLRHEAQRPAAPARACTGRVAQCIEQGGFARERGHLQQTARLVVLREHGADQSIRANCAAPPSAA